MNLHLVARSLGVVSWLIGLTMVFSLPAAWPAVGGHNEFETRGFLALIVSIVVSFVVGFLLHAYGRDDQSTLYRKEAMAVVGLSWVLATVLGGIPYYMAGVKYRLLDDVPQRMGIAESLFESQSGFSTTGATVLTDIENPAWVPRCILFWRSSTHFLGGLGIIVLFVAILGQGSAGKALMRAEIPGPSKEGTQERMQHTAWTFAAIYCVLNFILTVLLRIEGMTWFDALCHSFGTMASGGFGTLNTSLAGFNSPIMEYTVIVFMILAGTNFTILYFASIGKPRKLFTDIEWMTYLGILAVAILLIVLTGVLVTNDFDPENSLSTLQKWETAFRQATFQAVSLMSTTGLVTADSDRWNNCSRATLLLLMLIGGCAGSTSGGLKVMRIILFTKILRREIKHAYHPSVVRHIRLSGEPIKDPDLVRNVLGYTGLALTTLILFWFVIVTIEPDSTWITSGHPIENKLLDTASAVIAVMHNVGPGMGLVGATQNFAPFTDLSKYLLTILMMLGRIEIYAILVLVIPSFWRDR